MTTLKKILKWTLYYPILILVCFEIALLILGYRRYQTQDYEVAMQPEYAFEADRVLGISLKTGTYTITLNKKVEFTASHTNEKRRFTPRPTADSLEKKIAFLGCSFTYGYGVDDSETFVATLQQTHPNWHLDNYGVIGYGTVQSFIQLQEIVQKGETDAVILNFSSFHFMRNALTQTYRKNLKLGYAHSSELVDSVMKNAEFPYINSCDCEPKYAAWSNMHENWIGREYFASVNWLQTFLEQYEDAQLDPIELTRCLFIKMQTICDQAGIQFGIVCLDSTEETDALRQKVPSLPWIDVGFDFESTDKTFIPYDSHPNQAGHAQIAEKIAPFIHKLVGDE